MNGEAIVLISRQMVHNGDGDMQLSLLLPCWAWTQLMKHCRSGITTSWTAIITKDIFAKMKLWWMSLMKPVTGPVNIGARWIWNWTTDRESILRVKARVLPSQSLRPKLQPAAQASIEVIAPRQGRIVDLNYGELARFSVQVYHEEKSPTALLQMLIVMTLKLMLLFAWWIHSSRCMPVTIVNYWCPLGNADEVFLVEYSAMFEAVVPGFISILVCLIACCINPVVYRIEDGIWMRLRAGD